MNLLYTNAFARTRVTSTYSNVSLQIIISRPMLTSFIEQKYDIIDPKFPVREQYQAPMREQSRNKFYFCFQMYPIYPC